MDQAMKYLKASKTCSVLTSGFTLPEMLVTLAIAIILISMTAPSMQSLIVSQRVTSATREVFGALLLARSEAVKQQRSVSLCSTADGISCDQNNTGWQRGWLIFTDADSDGLLENGDQLIRSKEAQPEQITISWNRGFSVTFNSRGQTGTAGTFEICGDDNAKAIIISLTGRSRVEEREVCS